MFGAANGRRFTCSKWIIQSPAHKSCWAFKNPQVERTSLTRAITAAPFAPSAPASQQPSHHQLPGRNAMNLFTAKVSDPPFLFCTYRRLLHVRGATTNSAESCFQSLRPLHSAIFVLALFIYATCCAVPYKTHYYPVGYLLFGAYFGNTDKEGENYRNRKTFSAVMFKGYI